MNAPSANYWLITGGILSAVAAVLHIAVIIGGANWYRFFGAGEGIPINYYNRSLFFVIIAYTEPAQARGIKGLPHYSAQFLHSGKQGNEFHPR